MSLLSIITGRGKTEKEVSLGRGLVPPQQVAVDDIQYDISVLRSENDFLRQTVISLNKKFEGLERDFLGFRHLVEETKQTVVESATTNVIGKVTALNMPLVDAMRIEESQESLRKLASEYVRLIRSKFGGRHQAPWISAYSELAQLTGFNVYDYGKTSLKEGGKYTESLINTVVAHGYLAELVVILQNRAIS